MKQIRVQDRVTVNKDVYRLEELYEIKEGNDRKEILYAGEGDRGTVVDVFLNQASKHKPCLHAKVLMDSTQKIKTFRLTTLDVFGRVEKKNKK
jgi:hypothetical protein